MGEEQPAAAQIEADQYHTGRQRHQHGYQQLAQIDAPAGQAVGHLVFQSIVLVLIGEDDISGDQGGVETEAEDGRHHDGGGMETDIRVAPGIGEPGAQQQQAFPGQANQQGNVEVLAAEGLGTLGAQVISHDGHPRSWTGSSPPDWPPGPRRRPGTRRPPPAPG